MRLLRRYRYVSGAFKVQSADLAPIPGARAASNTTACWTEPTRAPVQMPDYSNLPEAVSYIHHKPTPGYVSRGNGEHILARHGRLPTSRVSKDAALQGGVEFIIKEDLVPPNWASSQHTIDLASLVALP